jgi:protein SCO1
MLNEKTDAATMTEKQFTALVYSIVLDTARQDELTVLLQEEHPLYSQHGAAAVVRMRGWILLALARVGISDDALVYILEELDTGNDAYLVATAARALRTYQTPKAAFAPFVIRAINNIRYHDEPVSFESYGGYAVSSSSTSPVRELLATLAWLGSAARGSVRDIELLRAKSGGLPKKLQGEVSRIIQDIDITDQLTGVDNDDCCKLPNSLTRSNKFVESIVFEDHNGEKITFNEFFRACPSIVVFFYTRCDNPLKCSLTITKLAHIQELLKDLNFDGQIKTAAITYDPAFDTPKRLCIYGRDRGVQMTERHRMLRTIEGFKALHSHFELGVNFNGSLVNRHRVEAYVLNAEGQIAASFERLLWDEQKVVDCAVDVLNETFDKMKTENFIKLANSSTNYFKKGNSILSPLAFLGLAFFPKCPICWAAYLSFFGIAGLKQIPYSPWLQPVFVAIVLINLFSVWLRGRATGHMIGFYFVLIGVFMIISSKIEANLEGIAGLGVAVTFVGSILSALIVKNNVPEKN